MNPKKHSVVFTEKLAEIEGFAAALAGKPKNSNPHSGKGAEFWLCGWECYKQKLFPPALEEKYRQRVSATVLYRMYERFRKNRYISPAMLRIIEFYSN